MRIRPLLFAPVVAALVLVSGCAKAETSNVQYGPPVTAEPSPKRTVTAADGEGLTCVDELGDVDSDPGFDIDRVTIGLDGQYLTATFTVGQLAYASDANTEFQLYIDPTGDGDHLSLSGWLTWTNKFSLGQWTSEGGERDVVGETSSASLTHSGSDYVLKWPLDDLYGDIPADFDWHAHVVYNQNKHDSCPGGRGVSDESMHGSWTVPPAP